MYSLTFLLFCSAILRGALAIPTKLHQTLSIRDALPSSNATLSNFGRPEDELTAKIAELKRLWPNLRLLEVKIYPQYGLIQSWIDTQFRIFSIHAYNEASHSIITARNCLPYEPYRWQTDVAPMRTVPGPTFDWNVRVFTVHAALAEVRQDGILLGAPGLISISFQDHPRWAPDLAGVFYDFMDPTHMRVGAALGPDGVVYSTTLFAGRSSPSGTIGMNGTVKAAVELTTCDSTQSIFS